MLRDTPSSFAIPLMLLPCRDNTRISTHCSWVNIGGPKTAILYQVGQFYFDDMGQSYIGANSNALDRWAYRNRVTLRLIQAGKPTQHAYVESFNGKFRDECLNEHWFRSLAEAREIVGAWRADYNQRRSHSALRYQTPAEFAAAWRARHAGHARQEAST